MKESIFLPRRNPGDKVIKYISIFIVRLGYIFQALAVSPITSVDCISKIFETIYIIYIKYNFNYFSVVNSLTLHACATHYFFQERSSVGII